MNYADSFTRNGYALIPSVFSAAEIARLRETADQVTATPSPFAGDVDNDAKLATSRADIYARYPEFRWVLFHQPLIDGLKEVLGTPVIFVPEHPLQKGFYSNWHRDTSSPRRDKQTWYQRPGFRVAQVAIYLQDNKPDLGGGLDVVPGSHQEVRQEWLEDLGTEVARRMPLLGERNRSRMTRLLTLPARLPAKLRTPLSLPIHAGDVVAFDLRIRHRATRGSVAANKPAASKYGMFLVCSANNRGAQDYLRYARDLRKNEAMLAHEFPAEMKTRAAEMGVVLL